MATDIFDPNRYAETRKPIEHASPLPPDVYFAQEWYDREVDTIFRKGWLIATREEEIPNPGDYVRLDIIEEPLIILRDEQGAIRAMSASCRHRGSELLEGSGNCKKISCPYHAWTYALDGRLLATPSMKDAEGFDKSAHGLPTVRAETWGGFVFINFDDDAVALLESLGSLVDRLAPYRMEEMKVTKKWENRFNANWKIWVENSREGYHVRTVHKESLDTYYPGAVRTAFKAAGEPMVWACSSSDNENGLYVPRDHTLPFVDGLSDEDNQSTHFIIHYPHLLLNVPPDRITFHQFFPEGPEWTRIVSWCCFPQSTIDLPNFEADAEEKYYPSMDLFLAEDKGICEVVHRGLRGTLSSLTRYSPTEEKTVHEFSNYVLDHVLGSAVAE